MSTHWNLKCATCGDEVRVWANHGERALASLIESAPVLADLGRRLPWYPVSLDAFDVCASEMRTVAAAWFAKHDGHRLVPFSEYGREPTDCLKTLACATCNTRKDCCLKAQHVGGCSPNRPPEAEAK